MRQDVRDEIAKTLANVAERELELCRREYDEAGQRVRRLRTALDSAVEELMLAAVRFGQAEEAVRHGGYGPEPT
jgi:hypothetical protein